MEKSPYGIKIVSLVRTRFYFLFFIKPKFLAKREKEKEKEKFMIHVRTGANF